MISSGPYMCVCAYVCIDVCMYVIQKIITQIFIYFYAFFKKWNGTLTCAFSSPWKLKFEIKINNDELLEISVSFWWIFTKTK